jgi:hypothetical protein
MLLVSRYATTAKVWEKYLKEVKDYKDQGLYANDIDTGKMKL